MRKKSNKKRADFEALWMKEYDKCNSVEEMIELTKKRLQDAMLNFKPSPKREEDIKLFEDMLELYPDDDDYQNQIKNSIKNIKVSIKENI